MAFDLSTAKPVGQSAPAAPRKFDLASARPVGEQPRPLDVNRDGMQDMPSLPGEPSMPSAPLGQPEKPGILDSLGKLGAARQDQPSILGVTPGMAETALSAVTGAVAPFIASARGLIGGYEPSNAEIEESTYQPRSEEGQAGNELLGELFSALPQDTDHALLGMVPEAPGGLPHGPRAPKAPKPAPVLSEGQATAARIREQGLKLTPKEASQITGDKNYFGRALQAIGGESRISKDIAASNRPVLNKMGQKAVGSDSLTEQGLQPVKEHGNAVYNEMSSLGTMQPTPELHSAVEQARSAAGKSTQRNVEIDKFVDGILNEFGGEVDAGQVVNRVRELRRDAQNAMKGEGDKRPTIQQEALGQAQRTVADALDDFLEYNASLAGKPDLAAKYKENRVRLAKVGTVEGATRAGNLNAKEVFEAKKKGAPLSGKLNEVAVAHEYAPESTSPLGAESVMEAPGRNLGLGDLLVAGVQNVARHMGVNKFLQSDLYQNMIGGREGGPHLAEHDTNPNAFPPVAPANVGPPRPPAPVPRPGVDFAGELGLAPDAPYETLPGGVGAPRNGRNLADDGGLRLVEDTTPAGVAPNALRNGPDEINFEAVNPEDVGPYRVNTDLNFSDARPVSGVQRGAALDTGDLELLPDAPTGPQDVMPPKPANKPRQGGAPKEPRPKPAPKAPQAAAQPPEGLSELGAMIDQMLSTKRATAQQQPTAKPYYTAAESPPPLPKRAGDRPPPTESILEHMQRVTGKELPMDFAKQLGLADDAGPKEAFADRYLVPGSKRVGVSPKEGYIAYETKNGRRQINDAYVAESARGKGLGQKNLMKLAKEAADAGEPLDSDFSITPAQARVYISAKKKGLIDFDITDKEAWDEALKEGTIAKAGGSPVIRNIRLVETADAE
jgi:hypothetical protein